MPRTAIFPQGVLGPGSAQVVATCRRGVDSERHPDGCVVHMVILQNELLRQAEGLLDSDLNCIVKLVCESSLVELPLQRS